MKKLLLILLLFIQTLLISKETKEVTLQLPWKFQFQFAGYIIAKEKGFYKDADLKVQLKQWEDKNVVDELISSKVEYAVLRPTSMIDISKGKNLIYLATIFQSSPLILLTDKSTQIKSISDFRNKKIMTSGDLSADVSLLSMISSEGIHLEDLIIQKPSFNSKDLLNKKTDLIAAYISNEPYTLKEYGGEPVIFNPKDFGFDFYSDILTTSKDYLIKNEEEVRKFREISLKGWEYAFSNIEESVDIIYNKYNTQKKSRNALLYEAKELRKLAYYNTNKIGKLDPEKLEKIYNIYKVLGLAQKTIDFNNIIYKDFKSKIELNNEEKKYLLDNQPIKICVNSHLLPFEKVSQDDQYTGIIADYYKILERDLSTNFELVKTNLKSEALGYIKDNKCDVISFTTKNRYLYNDLNLTSTIFKVPLVVTTKLEVPFVNKIEDLKDQKIAISNKSIHIDSFKNKYPNLNIVEVNNIKEGLNLLNEGKVYGYIDTLYSVVYKLQTEHYKNLKIAGKINDELEYTIGIKKDDEILLSIFEKLINNITIDEMKRLTEKWDSTIYEKSIDYTLLWQIFTPFILILIFGLFFYTKLKILNKKLSEQKKFINKILDIQPNLIFIINNSKAVFANRFFLDFYDCKDLEEFQDKYKCLAKTFIQEKLFFHLGKINDDTNSWIENILKLKSEKRIVSIIHPITLVNKVFNVSVVELEENKYLISLTDITDTILKQIQLENKTNHDKLTGAYNREYFESHYKLIINDYTKDNHLLVFAILDIDFFKKVNDSYGHNIGDKVLQKFVEIIQKYSRNDDLVIRWGGEEFILLLKVNSIESGTKVLENIRKIIQESHFDYVEQITCSIGGTIYQNEENIENTFKRADEALYKAKNSGRNRVITRF